MHDIAGLCKLYSTKTFLETCKGDVWHFKIFDSMEAVLAILIFSFQTKAILTLIPVVE